MTTILFSVLALCLVAVFFAVIIYGVDIKFRVVEDPRIDEIVEILPGANCGGCGFAGCRNFAEAIVKAGNMDNLYCPVGGNVLVKQVSSLFGVEAHEREPQVAVVRCQGSFINAPQKVIYDGLQKCAYAHSVSMGESGCPNACLGFGDCVSVCNFDAIIIDDRTGIPIVFEDKCTACSACVKACPRNIIELRNKGAKGRRVYVGCVNIEKGCISKKNCSVSCIACSKCLKVCPFGAVSIVNDKAYIDFEKCKLCRKCVAECPTGAIVEVNFPSPKNEKNANVSEDSN